MEVILQEVKKKQVIALDLEFIDLIPIYEQKTIKKGAPTSFNSC